MRVPSERERSTVDRGKRVRSTEDRESCETEVRSTVVAVRSTGIVVRPTGFAEVRSTVAAVRSTGSAGVHPTDYAGEHSIAVPEQTRLQAAVGCATQRCHSLGSWDTVVG